MGRSNLVTGEKGSLMSNSFDCRDQLSLNMARSVLSFEERQCLRLLMANSRLRLLMREYQVLETHLKRRSDFTGNLSRILLITSGGMSDMAFSSPISPVYACEKWRDSKREGVWRKWMDFRKV